MNPQVTPTPPVNPAPNPTPPASPMPASPPVAPVAPLSPIAPDNKKRGPKWIKIVLGLFVGLAVLGGILFFTVMQATKAPQKISDQFVNAIQAKDSTAAYELTSDEFKQATSSQDMQTFVDSIGPKIQGDEKITDRTIQKSAGNATNATFIYTVDTPEGKIYIKTIVQETSGQWRIYNIKTDSNPLTTDNKE